MHQVLGFAPRCLAWLALLAQAQGSQAQGLWAQGLQSQDLHAIVLQQPDLQGFGPLGLPLQALHWPPFSQRRLA